MKSERGLYICDGCDTPVDEARLYHIRPRADLADRLPSNTRVETVTLAFCPKCQKDKAKMRTVAMAAGKELNEWLTNALK